MGHGNLGSFSLGAEATKVHNRQGKLLYEVDTGGGRVQNHGT